MGGAPASDLPPAGSGECCGGDELVRGTCHPASLHDGGGGGGGGSVAFINQRDADCPLQHPDSSLSERTHSERQLWFPATPEQSGTVANVISDT